MKKGTFASPAIERASKVLPVPGGPTKQHALGDAPAQALKLLRIAQEVDNLFQLFLGLIDAGDILEGHPAGALGQKLGARLAEAHGLAAARLHLAQEEDPHPDQQQHREPVDEDAHQRGHAVIGGLHADIDVVIQSSAW